MFAHNNANLNVTATASTTEMVRAFVGAGVGISVLNMRPKTDLSNAGDKLCAIPIDTTSAPIRLVLGHMGGNQRRLVNTFADAFREYFNSDAALDLIVTHKA
jgi:DNA-binding transcriptional LysR family regulator